MTSPDSDALRRRLIDSLAEGGYFRAEWLRLVFERVPRERFAPDTVWTWSDRRWRPLNRREDPERWAGLVYHATEPLITQVDDGGPAEDGTGSRATSSMSSAEVVLNMLASLDPQPGHSVLELGTGTGYNAALLCERVGAERVVTVEIDPVLTDLAGKRLKAAGYQPLVVCGNGEAGYPDRAPYDRLISTASVRRVPPAWLRQVKAGGEIVVPWLPNARGFGLIWLRMREDGSARGWFHGREAFMPVRGQRYGRTADLGDVWDATYRDAEVTQGDSGLADLSSGDARFALGVLLPGVEAVAQADGWFLMTADQTSWASAVGDRLYRYGRRDLFAEAGRVLSWWRGQDRPTLYEFGITVTGEEQLVWLRDEKHILHRTGPA